MKSQIVPIVLNLIAALFGALGQYLYKLGAGKLKEIPLWSNWPLFAGMAMFCVVMGLFVTSFRLGGRLSVVYPAYASTFVWGAVVAVLLAGETVGALQIAGIAAILVGITMIALGAG